MVVWDSGSTAGSLPEWARQRAYKLRLSNQQRCDSSSQLWGRLAPCHLAKGPHTKHALARCWGVLRHACALNSLGMQRYPCVQQTATPSHGAQQSPLGAGRRLVPHERQTTELDTVGRRVVCVEP